MKNKALSILFISACLLCGCNDSTNPEVDPPLPPEDNYYSVTYIPNGGTGSLVEESIKENTEYEIKDFMFTPPSGKVFNSWTIDNIVYQPKDKITVTKDIEIIATYKDEESTGTTYTVTYDPGRGNGYMEPQVIDEGFSIKLPKCTFTPPLGESFVCWYDGFLTWKEGKEVEINEDTVFTAIYDKNGKDVYTVSFASNGGSGTMDSVQVEEGLYTLPSCTFTAPSNKTFDYWSISSGTTHYQAGQQINVTGDVVVTANWKNIVSNKYTVSYNANGGTGSIASTTVEENTWIYLAYNTFTAPSGKEFDCWTINSQNYDEHQAYKVTSNVTVYAKWKDKEVVPPEADWEDDKVMLECGFYNMGIPSNKDNPVEIRTTLSSDSSSWFNTTFDGDVDNGYRYIYKNSCSDGPSGHKCSVSTYANGSLKITSPGLGFGSPYFTHTGAKLEFRIGINGVYNNSEKPDKEKDTFHIYMFDKDNKYLGKTQISENTITTSTTEVKTYYTNSNCAQVKFFEVRCNALPYKTSQCYNVGISYCNVKSWERV